MPLIDDNQTPQEVWEALLEGNQRFTEDRVERPNADSSRRMSLRSGQSPRVVVLSCSDSRAPVELIFDLGLGDAFVIRTAGHIVDNSVLGSLEYAVENLDCNLIVVMGHQHCGAIGAANSVVNEGATIPSGFQRTIIEKVALSATVASQRGKSAVEDIEREHTIQSVRQLIASVPSLSQKIVNGTLGIAGVHYSLDEGIIEPLVLHGIR